MNLASGIGQNLLLQLRASFRRGPVMRKPFLRFLQREVLAQGAADLTEFAILAGGNAEEHLLDEAGLGTGTAGGKYPRKPVHLLAQSAGDLDRVQGGLRGEKDCLE
jgi:hypothetical protein